MVGQTYTKGGRQRTAPLPTLVGKEWGVAKTLRDTSLEQVAIQKELLSVEQQKLESFNEFKNKMLEFIGALVQVEEEKLQIQKSQIA